MRRYVIPFGLILFPLLAAAGEITSPESFLGFRPGDDFQIANYETIIAYFKQLDRQSDNVQLEELGFTTERRPLYLVKISAKQNLQNSGQIIANQARLADPPAFSNAEAEPVVRQTPVIVSINCSIHAREIGPSQMAMELAYQLASRTDEEMQTILKHVVLLLIPVHNPDGLDTVVEWYNAGRESTEEVPLRKLDHPVCGHDVNRDWFILSQPETRLTVEKVYNVWRPNIVLDLHQMGSRGARMFLPPFVDPHDPYMDPILQAELTALGSAMGMEMAARNLTGVVHNAYFDSFSPARSYIYYHAGIRLLGEIASANLAAPIVVTPSELQQAGDFNPGQRSWRQPLPWPGGRWSLHDIVTYALEASLALLRQAAANHSTWIRNSRLVVQNAVSDTSRQLYYIVPMSQHDPNAAYEMLSLLKSGMVRLYRCHHPIAVQGRTLEPPIFVIPSRQPYGAYAQTLLEKTNYIQLAGSSAGPYDVTTHHLPSLFGVETIRYSGELSDLEPVDVLEAPSRARPPSSAHGILVDYRSNQAVKVVTEALKRGLPTFWLMDSTRTREGDPLPPGTVLIRSEATQWTGRFHTDQYQPAVRGTLRALKLKSVRVGLYTGTTPEMDEGWTQFLLQEFGFTAIRLNATEIRNDNLKTNFDVLVFTDHSSDRLAQALAAPDNDRKGLEALHLFVDQGGTLVLLNRSSDLVIGPWNLGVKNVVKDLKANEYFVPGSLLRLQIDTNQPLGYGLQSSLCGLVQNSPVFAVAAGAAESVARYGAAQLLESGLLVGEHHLALQSAVVSAPVGSGRVVLMGLRPQFRAQSRATYKLFFNALLFSGAQPVSLF
jgi:hypothetical protein